MPRRLPVHALTGLIATAILSGNACAQEALTNDDNYLLASKTPQAVYFVSGIQRGAEPGSIEAWVWTVPRNGSAAPAKDYDALAQFSVMRCTGRSIEVLKTERYLGGKFVDAVNAPPTIPASIKDGTPMDGVWNVACTMSRRFEAKIVESVSEMYGTAAAPLMASAAPAP